MDYFSCADQDRLVKKKAVIEKVIAGKEKSEVATMYSLTLFPLAESTPAKLEAFVQFLTVSV